MEKIFTILKYRDRKSLFRVASLSLIILSALVCTNVFETEDTANVGWRRNLSVVYESCSVGSINLPSTPIIPIVAASYPGSGSQMAHYLFEALTGLEAGDEWYHRGDTYDHITIKTHYPARDHKIKGARLMKRVILLLRNPIFSLPSHHNFVYEKENNIPDHTLHAPLDTWIGWRDQNFEKELENWKKLVEFWVKHTKKDDRLVIAFEHLIDHKQGPVETTRINSFLARTDGVRTLPVSKVPCVWDKIVNYEAKDEKEGIERRVVRGTKYVNTEDPTHPEHSRRSGPKVDYVFTLPQLKQVKSVLSRLRAEFITNYTLVTILSEYIKVVDSKLDEAKSR
jgi:hypothetical protein